LAERLCEKLQQIKSLTHGLFINQTLCMCHTDRVSQLACLHSTETLTVNHWQNVWRLPADRYSITRNNTYCVSQSVCCLHHAHWLCRGWYW